MAQDYSTRPSQGYSQGYSSGVDQRAMAQQRPSTAQQPYRTTTTSAGAPVVTSLRLPKGYPTTLSVPKTSLLLDKKGHWVQPKSTLSTAAEQAAMRKTQPAMPVAEVVSYLDESPRAADAESMAWVTKLQNLPYERASKRIDSVRPRQAAAGAQRYAQPQQQYPQQQQQYAQGAPPRVGNAFLTDLTAQRDGGAYPAYPPQQQQWAGGSVYSDSSALPQRKGSSRASSVKDYNFEYEAPYQQGPQWGSGQYGQGDGRSGGYNSQAPSEQVSGYGPPPPQQQQQGARGYARQPQRGGSVLDNPIGRRQAPPQQQQQGWSGQGQGQGGAGNAQAMRSSWSGPQGPSDPYGYEAGQGYGGGEGGGSRDRPSTPQRQQQQQQYGAMQRPGSAQPQRRNGGQQQRPASTGGHHLFDQQRPNTPPHFVYEQEQGQQGGAYAPRQYAYGPEDQYQQQAYNPGARQMLPQSQGWEDGKQEEWGSQMYRDPQGWPVREVSPPRNPHYFATTHFMDQAERRQQQEQQQRWQGYEDVDQGPEEYVARGSMRRQAWQEGPQQGTTQHGQSGQMRQSSQFEHPAQYGPQPGEYDQPLGQYSPQPGEYDQPLGQYGQQEGQYGQYSATVPKAAARQAAQPPAQQNQRQQRSSSSSGAPGGSYPPSAYAQPLSSDSWQRQSMEKGVQVPTPHMSGYVTPDTFAPRTPPPAQRSYYFDPAKGLMPGNKQLTDADLTLLREMNLGQQATPGSPNTKLVGSHWKFVYDRQAGDGDGEQERLTGRDISRTQPWGTDFLGQHVVPGSPNAKLVGGKYRLVPNEVEGPALWTDYYGPVGGGQELATYYGRKYYDGPLNLVPRA